MGDIVAVVRYRDVGILRQVDSGVGTAKAFWGCLHVNV